MTAVRKKSRGELLVELWSCATPESRKFVKKYMRDLRRHLSSKTTLLDAFPEARKLLRRKP